MITTHILDTMRGKPAAGVLVTLERKSSREWKRLGRARTDANGRINGLLPEGSKPAKGIYRLTFETGAYFGAEAFYPAVVVTFRLLDSRHHHIPLLLSPYGYSTYRGS